MEGEGLKREILTFQSTENSLSLHSAKLPESLSRLFILIPIPISGGSLVAGSIVATATPL
jgi:hypothetical protein